MQPQGTRGGGKGDKGGSSRLVETRVRAARFARGGAAAGALDRILVDYALLRPHVPVLAFARGDGGRVAGRGPALDVLRLSAGRGLVRQHVRGPVPRGGPARAHRPGGWARGAAGG